MKTMIAGLFAAFTLLAIPSCGDEESAFEYPRVYTYQNFEIRSSQYVELKQDGWESVTPGGNFALLENEVLNVVPDFEFRLEEVILLDETTTKITAFFPDSGLSVDTTFNYLLDDNKLQIPSFNPEAYFELSDDMKSMDLCNFTYYHTRLSSQFPQITHSPIVNDYCGWLDGADPVEYVKDQFDWVPGDTVATVFSAFVYELE